MKKLTKAVWIALALSNLSFNYANASIFDRKWVDDEIKNVSNKVNATQTRVQTLIQDRADVLSVIPVEDIMAMVNEYKAFLQNEQDDVNLFLGENNNCYSKSQCYKFKIRLKSYLLKIESIQDKIKENYGTENVSLSFKLSNILDTSENIPSRLLYPLYKVGVASDSALLLLDDLLGHLSNHTATFSTQTTSNRDKFDDAWDAANGGSRDDVPFTFAPFSCDFMKNESGIIEETKIRNVTRASTVLVGFGTVFRITGLTLKALGHTIFGGKEIDAGASFANVHLKSNHKMMLGIALDGIGKVLNTMGGSGLHKVSLCRNLYNQETIFLQNQDIEQQNVTIIQQNESVLSELCALSRYRSADCQAYKP